MQAERSVGRPAQQRRQSSVGSGRRQRARPAHCRVFRRRAAAGMRHIDMPSAAATARLGASPLPRSVVPTTNYYGLIRRRRRQARGRKSSKRRPTKKAADRRSGQVPTPPHSQPDTAGVSEVGPLPNTLTAAHHRRRCLFIAGWSWPCGNEPLQSSISGSQ